MEAAVFVITRDRKQNLGEKFQGRLVSLYNDEIELAVAVLMRKQSDVYLVSLVKQVGESPLWRRH